MKVGIDRDEKFPFYTITDYRNRWALISDVPLSQLRRWKRVMKEFESVQAEMAKAYTMTEFRNLYYFDPKRIDLNVLRKEAVRKSSDDRFGTPGPVVIHYHGAGEDCTGLIHETYEEGAKVE